ncbi:hypothetical protein [Thermoflexibacter ruber]|nr:hypothetical protein [Thermoflexibacter ruber]
MEIIQLPLTEYQSLQEEINLLKNTDLLIKMNRLIDLLFQDKYGLYMGNFTDDLTECIIDNSWDSQNSAWDNV